MAGAVPRGEALTLRVHPGLQLGEWKAGGFRLLESSVAADGGQTLSLQSGLVRADGGRPSAKLRPAAPEFRARERLWWEPAADRPRLTAELTCDVRRGPVFGLAFPMPPGWEVIGPHSPGATTCVMVAMSTRFCNMPWMPN